MPGLSCSVVICFLSILIFVPARWVIRRTRAIYIADRYASVFIFTFFSEQPFQPWFSRVSGAKKTLPKWLRIWGWIMKRGKGTLPTSDSSSCLTFRKGLRRLCLSFIHFAGAAPFFSPQKNPLTSWKVKGHTGEGQGTPCQPEASGKFLFRRQAAGIPSSRKLHLVMRPNPSTIFLIVDMALNIVSQTDHILSCINKDHVGASHATDQCHRVCGGANGRAMSQVFQHLRPCPSSPPCL